MLSGVSGAEHVVLLLNARGTGVVVLRGLGGIMSCRRGFETYFQGKDAQSRGGLSASCTLSTLEVRWLNQTLSSSAQLKRGVNCSGRMKAQEALPRLARFAGKA